MKPIKADKSLCNKPGQDGKGRIIIAVDYEAAVLIEDKRVSIIGARLEMEAERKGEVSSCKSRRSKERSLAGFPCGFAARCAERLCLSVRHLVK
jgi:hypothetical protein